MDELPPFSEFVDPATGEIFENTGKHDDSDHDEVVPSDSGGVLPPPINWWVLNQRERVAVLHRLRPWVRMLVRSYELRPMVVQSCWFLHEPMIQELLALMQFRDEIQFAPMQAGNAALEFHERFTHWRERMRLWVENANCRAQSHIAPISPNWVVKGTSAYTVDDERYEAFALALWDAEAAWEYSEGKVKQMLSKAKEALERLLQSRRGQITVILAGLMIVFLIVCLVVRFVPNRATSQPIPGVTLLPSLTHAATTPSTESGFTQLSVAPVLGEWYSSGFG